MYVTDLLLTLAEAGGIDNQSYDQCYECLTSTPSSIFNSEITVLKQAHHTENNVDKLKGWVPNASHESHVD